MGLDRTVVDLLLRSVKSGVDFSKIGTLGRQELCLNNDETLSRIQSFKLNQVEARIKQSGFDSNKFNDAETFLKALSGGSVTAIDNSDYQEAEIIIDLNKPISSEHDCKFSVVLDGGTLEHVFNFSTAISNAMRMVQVGGHFLGIIFANNQMGHGFYQISPELAYRVFSEENGFENTQVYLVELPDNGSWFKVPDPALVGRRVILKNKRPTYLLISSQKMFHIHPFQNPPQQSDYTTRWKGENLSRPKKAEKGVIKSIYHRLIPSAIRESLYHIKSKTTRPLEQPEFERISNP